MFSKLDNVFRLKLHKYFEIKDLVCSERDFETLIIPIRAGGAVIQRDLPKRLLETFPNKRENEILEISIDLNLLLADTVKDYNYVRYLQNAVNGRLNSVLDPDTADLIPEISARVKKNLEIKQQEIWSYSIQNITALENWIEKVIDFVEQVNDLHGANDFVYSGDGEENRAPSKKVLAARKSKNYVNTKTLTTYSSRTQMYIRFKSRTLFPGMIRGDEPVEKMFMKYKTNIALSNIDLSVLKDKAKREKSHKEFISHIKKQKMSVDQGDLMTVEFPFSGDRIIKICHSQNGVFRELISPIITSLKAQIKLEPNKVKRFAKVENSTGFLSVEIDNIKNSEIPKIQSTLEALVS